MHLQKTMQKKKKEVINKNIVVCNGDKITKGNNQWSTQLNLDKYSHQTSQKISISMNEEKS